MNIKDNIDKDVLSTVANKMNVTEDLLIQMISKDLHNHTILVLTLVVVALLVGVILGILSYYRFKNYDHDFFAEAFAFASGVIFVLSVLIFILSEGYSKHFEVVNNNEYAVVKEINEMYDKIVNPAEEPENQQ